MVRVLAVIEYDGTDFTGFQLQVGRTPPFRTVQGELEAALGTCTGEAVRVIGSGRTDTGVHARGQVVHFDTQAGIASDPPQLLRALNALLPVDVKVRALRAAPATLHARYSATSRRYCYRVYASASPSPLHRRHAHHVRARLDVQRMSSGAQHLVGSHDFVAFAGQEGERSTVRAVFGIRVSERHGQSGESWASTWATSASIWHTSSSAGAGSTGHRGTPPVEDARVVVESAAQLVEIDVEATGFLRHMMRRIAGTLIRVGDGRLAPDDVASILASREKSLAGPTVPARGLCLEEVKYQQL